MKATVLTALVLAAACRLCAATAADSNPAINLTSDIASKISACWKPPHANDQITIRLGFTRDGLPIGRPRITFMKSSHGADGEADLANSILMALHDCTPLRFTEGLAKAVAGQVLTIRFIAGPGKTLKAEALASAKRHEA